MLIGAEELDTKNKQYPLPDNPHATSSASAPPTFEESARDHVLQFSQDDTFTPAGGEEPPPFVPYDAQFFTSHSGDIISHDSHLNDDGEALYRFLLSQASTPPTVILRCKGSHNETHTRLVSSPHNGHTKMKTEQYTERITDFEFCIDVGQHIVGGPTHWSCADSTPAYRGRMYQEVGINEERQKAKKSEIRAAKGWDSERAHRGFPPWIGSDYVWREDQPYLKEFNYRKIAYGWNFEAIRVAAISVINSTHYRGDLSVEFETSESVVSIRSHNRLSRALSNRWIKFLLFLTLIYPLIWLFKRFHPRGGGCWDVCGGAYALKRIEQEAPAQQHKMHTESPFRDAVEILDVSAQSSSLVDTSSGSMRVLGLREGEWFRRWEGTIRRAVLNRLQDAQPLTTPDDQPSPLSLMLDGY